VETRRDVAILKVTGKGVRGEIDEVAAELPISLILNGEPLVTLLCTPDELTELAAGFLLSEGILQDRASLKKIEVMDGKNAVHIELSDLPDDWRRMFETRTLSSGCGSGITFTHFRTGADQRIPYRGPMMTLGDVKELLKAFRDISVLYKETGGVHSAALSDGREILFFSEDIGRHNAVDKLIGKAFLKAVSLQNKILITSGRVTSEIVTKAGRNGFPILISRAAPSCMAIDYAEDVGITLVGFARGSRMNLYTWPKRIEMETQGGEE
jgi:FdhD protein